MVPDHGFVRVGIMQVQAIMPPLIGAPAQAPTMKAARVGDRCN